MEKNEINIIIRVSILLAFVLAFLYLLVNGIDFNLKNGFKAFSASTTIIIFFWGLYFEWGWKWPILKRIFYRPDLNGTWTGKLISDWKDSNGNGVEPIEFFIVIRQNFLRINFTTYTNKFIGKSYSEQINLDKERGVKNVAYLYRKETSQNSKCNDEGATELRVIESKINRLIGKYWSNIKTNGEVDVSFLVKRHFDSYEDIVNYKMSRNE
jgi:hypothetical protein